MSKRTRPVSELVDFWFERLPDDWADIPKSVNGRTLFSMIHRRMIDTRHVVVHGRSVTPEPGFDWQWRRKAVEVEI